MDKKTLDDIAVEIEQEDSLFKNKAYLDNLTMPSSIIGREDKAKELARLLLSYRRGLVVPFISVYGRSGSGKSTVVRFVCENLDGVISVFVNLRKAKTVFGCVNLILAAMGQQNLKSAQGLNLAMDRIGSAIESALVDRKKLFVLVLDEFDVLLNDKRGRPSDFLYKLLTMEEKLREKGLLATTIAISNNVVSNYELDDRVKSRMGGSEVFFNPYNQQDVAEILFDRISGALSRDVEPEVIEYCARLSSEDHGDARRALDLLRLAAEEAGREQARNMRFVSKRHVDRAVERLQKDRVDIALAGASHHLKVLCFSIARLTYLTGETWHATSRIYSQYSKLIYVSGGFGKLAETPRPLRYRRISDMLVELENAGIVISHTASRGRQGYGTQFKLKFPHGIIGRACFEEWWNKVVIRKKEHDRQGDLKHQPTMDEIMQKQAEQDWKEYVGIEDEDE